jgi:hypothetical protein
MLRTLQLWGNTQRVDLKDLSIAKDEWSRWSKSSLLKRIGYGTVRDAMVDFSAVRWRGPESMPWTAFSFLECIGTKCDTKIVDMLMAYKQDSPRHVTDMHHLPLSISHFLGTLNNRHSLAALGDHTIVMLVKKVSQWGNAIHRRDLSHVLELMHRGGERLALILRGTCHEMSLRVLVMCIQRLAFEGESEEAQSVMIGDVIESINGHHQEIYSELIRILAESSENVVVMRKNRWMKEPTILGEDIAGVWDPCLWPTDVQAFTCAACLVRVLPRVSLWPILQKISDELNIAYNVKCCGFPGDATKYFTRVVSVFLKRDPTSRPYMLARWRTLGDDRAEWLLRLTEVTPKSSKRRRI